MKLFSVASLILVASSRVLAGVIGVSDQLASSNELVAAAEPISGLLTKAAGSQMWW